MNRAQRRGAALRRELGLRGRVDAEAVAAGLGLGVRPWHFAVQTEMTVDGEILIAERLGPEERRWETAHAIGHRLLHRGNHVEQPKHLRRRYEREADDFAHELLIDAEEAFAEGFVHSWEIAEHFGVPGEAVRVQARLVADDLASQPGDRPRRGY